MKKVCLGIMVFMVTAIGFLLISNHETIAPARQEDVQLSQLLGLERPYKIEVWSGLDGDLVVYESKEQIDAFLEIVQDETFAYVGKTVELTAGCDMSVTLFMEGNNINFIYFGEYFQLYRKDDRRGIGPYYEIADPYQNAADIHDYTGLVRPIGYDLD